MADIDKKYLQDDEFKRAARHHQSQYRENKLKVGYNKHKNILTDADADAKLNYYDGLNVSKALHKRYGKKPSRTRDANMLRSEHIPFNMLAPLCTDASLAKHIIKTAFGLESEAPYKIKIEFAPKPKELQPKDLYLNDATSFDTFIKFTDQRGMKIGLGIEVKYTEKGYPFGKTEKQNVENKESRYWQVTRESAAFIDEDNPLLYKNHWRQIWRNHLLGLSMCKLSPDNENKLDDFYSIILYPSGNQHFNKVIREYQSFLKEPSRQKVFGCTYEKFIQAIEGDEEILRWKQYLTDRYIVHE